MSDVAMLLAGLAGSCLGFALLALSQNRHWHRITGQPRPSTAVKVLRSVGYGLFGIALAIAIARDGASFGTILWAMTLSTSAGVVALVLTWRPTWLRYIAMPWSTRNNDR